MSGSELSDLKDGQTFLQRQEEHQGFRDVHEKFALIDVSSMKMPNNNLSELMRIAAAIARCDEFIARINDEIDDKDRDDIIRILMKREVSLEKYVSDQHSAAVCYAVARSDAAYFRAMTESGKISLRSAAEKAIQTAIIPTLLTLLTSILVSFLGVYIANDFQKNARNNEIVFVQRLESLKEAKKLAMDINVFITREAPLLYEMVDKTLPNDAERLRNLKEHRANINIISGLLQHIPEGSEIRRSVESNLRNAIDSVTEYVKCLEERHRCRPDTRALNQLINSITRAMTDKSTYG